MTETSASHIATLYRFCAHSMRYPDSRWFSMDYLDSLYLLLDSLDARQEREAIRRTLAESADPLEDLQIEYTRLFINGVPHVIAPPYGSVYMNRSLQGHHAEKTLQFYHAHGYSLKDDADFADHLIHQLEFLSLLADKQDSETETAFLRTIFLPWFGVFHSRVKQESRHPFYSVLVQLIDYLTKEDDEHGIQPNEA